MTDVPKAKTLPGRPFEAKARKKRRKGGEPAPAVTRTLPFDDVRPFLSGRPLHGIGGAPPASPKAPPAPPAQNPADPEADRDENIAA